MRRIFVWGDFYWCRGYEVSSVIKDRIRLGESREEANYYTSEFISTYSPTQKDIEDIVEMYFL